MSNRLGVQRRRLKEWTELETENRVVGDFNMAAHQNRWTLRDPRERQFLLDELRHVESKLLKRLSVIASESGQVSGELPAISFHKLKKKIILNLTWSSHKGPLAHRLGGLAGGGMENQCGEGGSSRAPHRLVDDEAEILGELSKRWHMFLSRNDVLAECCEEHAQPFLALGELRTR
jgi:hypothetical protein